MYEIMARYYDMLHEGLTADVEFMQRFLGTYGGPLLEIGCGSGRMTIPLAEAGHRVVGVDDSAEMLALARVKLAALPTTVQQRISLVEADVLTLLPGMLEQPFATAVVPHNTLYHFKRQQVPLLLRRIAGLMAINGRLVLDVTNPFLIEQGTTSPELVFETQFSDPVDGRPVVQWSSSALDEAAQTLHVSWIFKKDGAEVAHVEMVYTYIFPHQLELVLGRAGFKLRKVLGDYDGAGFDEDSERLLLVAEFVGY